MPENEMDREEFFRIEGDIPLYMQIELQLAEIGLAAERQPSLVDRIFGPSGMVVDAWAGIRFRNLALRLAGWDASVDGPYYTQPEKAAAVFERLRGVLRKTVVASEVLALLEGA
jgi:hypothetical protein